MHLFRAVYATLAVYYYCPPRVNGILFKAEIPTFGDVATTTDQETLRSYTASRHYDDYAIADPSGNVDGRRGLRLGEPGVQILEVLQTQPPTEPVSTAPPKLLCLNPRPKNRPSPNRPNRITTGGFPKPLHKTLAKDWTLNKDEHQSDVLDRVLAFAGVAKKLASIMELPVGQIAPDALLAAATTRFEALSGNLKDTADQMAQLKARHDASQRTIALLTSERDALAARVAALQAELKDAATRHARSNSSHSLDVSLNSPLMPEPCPCRTSKFPHATRHRRHNPSRRCRYCLERPASPAPPRSQKPTTHPQPR